MRTRRLGASSRMLAIGVGGILLIGLAIASSITAYMQCTHGLARTNHRGSGRVDTLDMTSPTSGWAWSSTLVVHTTDGAAHLVDVTPAGVSADRPVVAETALDAAHAWIVAGPSPGSGRLTIYRTHNGGATWAAANVAKQQAGDITFVDARHGWMQTSQLVDNHRVDEVTLSRTLNGGASWSTIYRTRQRIDIEPNVQTGDCQWSLVQFSTPLHGIIGLGCDNTATLKIDRTEDGGKTWRRETLPPLRHPARFPLFSAVQRPFLSGKSGAAFVTLCVGNHQGCTEYGSLYRSSDGGKTWSAGKTVVHPPGEAAVLTDSIHAWLPFACLKGCGSTPQLLRTKDGGTHWTAIRLPRALGPNLHGNRQFQFVSPVVGFAVASQEFDPQTHFYRTTNGGRSFHVFRPVVVRP